MPLATVNLVSQWPPAALYGALAGAIVVGLLLGFLVSRVRDHRAIAQRLSALGARLGVEVPRDNGRVETALAYLEEVTSEATTAVSESSAEAIRLRRSLDSLPLGLVLCDESGDVILRNAQAERMEQAEREILAGLGIADPYAEGGGRGDA